VIARSDSDIKQGVEAELNCCPDVDETHIVVNVARGTVTLSGYARNLFHKFGAEDVVRRVAGVLGIINDIQVQPTYPGYVQDSEIERLAVAAIKGQLPLCWEHIRPVVHLGKVTLQGAVEWIHQREEAEDAVRKVPGVIAVANAITLAKSAPALAPPPIQQRLPDGS